MSRFKSIISSVIAAMFLAGPVQAEITHVTMGTEGAYPPFNNVNEEGELVGFDIEIGNALCDAMDVTCDWVTSSWDGIIPALLAKKFDTIMASMSITEERKEKIAFTDKYYTSPVRFIRLTGTDFTPENIDGVVVGVQSATVSENLVNGKFSNAELKTYAEQEQANLDLTSGRVDLVAADAFVLMDFVDSEAGNDVEFVGPSYSDEEYLGEGIGIGVRKEDDELRKMLNDAIKQIRDDGTYQKINSKYFDFDVFGG